MATDNRLRVADPYFRLELMMSPGAVPLTREMLTQPGIVAITGQPASGKTTTIFRLAYEVSQDRKPVAVIWPKEDTVQRSLIFPENWQIHHIIAEEEAIKQFWSKFRYGKEQVVVTDQRVLDLWQNPDPAPIPRDAHILCTFDTPFVGLDVAYFLNSFLPSTQILEHFSGVVSQLLLPKLCKKCRVESASGWEEAGCADCNNSGFRGRASINDVLWINLDVKKCIRDFLDRDTLVTPPAGTHVSLIDSAVEALSSGTIGLKTFKRLLIQNPLLRTKEILQ